MKQKAKDLKNVSSYSSLEKPPMKAEEPLLFTGIKKKSTKNDIKALLEYQGLKEISLSGSFLNLVLEVTGLPVTLLIDILNVSRSTFYRIKDEKSLEQDMVDKLASILKLYNKGVKAFESNADFHTWLNTKIITLHNQKPIDLLRTENGRLAVSEAIDRVEYGIYG